MTREEAIEDLQLALSTGNYIFTKSRESLRMAISALSENKGDLISRQVVLDLLQMKYSGKELYKAIYDLPSVENRGEWIPVYGKNGKTIMSYKCSKCMFHPKHAIITDFCGGCGADMRGGKE